jgi:hypothetical protein
MMETQKLHFGNNNFEKNQFNKKLCLRQDLLSSGFLMLK